MRIHEDSHGFMEIMMSYRDSWEFMMIWRGCMKIYKDLKDLWELKLIHKDSEGFSWNREDAWEFMVINLDLWCFHRWIHDDFWDSKGFMEIHEDLWEFTRIHGDAQMMHNCVRFPKQFYCVHMCPSKLCCFKLEINCKYLR